MTYKLWQIFKTFSSMEWTPGYGTKNTDYLQPSMKKNLKKIDWTYKVQYPEGQELGVIAILFVFTLPQNGGSLNKV